MPAFSVYEEELFGKTHFRAVRDDGHFVLGQNHQVDFPDETEAIVTLCNDCRRNHVEEWQIRTHTRPTSQRKASLVPLACRCHHDQVHATHQEYVHPNFLIDWHGCNHCTHRGNLSNL